ncbi:glycoside hydrolase family 16 protein [Plicaturopsis crispa FD-325 SS-3]|nr:glycoside hydrolase family 16 protein [Plicaturopsis crispa FD-325 SS-3]
MDSRHIRRRSAAQSQHLKGQPIQAHPLAADSPAEQPNPFEENEHNTVFVPLHIRRQRDAENAGATSTTNLVQPQSGTASVAAKYSLSADPRSWGINLSPNQADPDDILHNPDPRRDSMYDGGGSLFTKRALANVGCLVILGVGLVALFAGYPLTVYLKNHKLSTLGGFNTGGINGSGQIPSMHGNWGLIDVETPNEAKTIQSKHDGADLQLVFSDEFNTDGRTFYPGDDPYWEAVDLHYWSTGNYEWYDPAAITTSNGSLKITLEKKETHNLHYQGGMMSTWNKFCFTGGYVETSVVLPGVNNIVGLWPAVWTMGNLGRAGYGASLDGMWPYTYDACDVGTVKNQTKDGLPAAATVNGDAGYGGVLSYLPGQRLSRCTCPGEDHPGPKHSDGTYVGRSAPEIDMFEAQISGGSGQVSQSGQWAPFNAGYTWFNTSDNEVIADPSISVQNTYIGGIYQQATSVVTNTDQECYEGNGGCFSVYGVEYKPGFDNAYISWVANNKISWTLNYGGVAADPRVEISARPVPQEPMYLLANLGMSKNFGAVDLDHLPFPVTMSVDYIRVYQHKDAINVGCDPPDFPTEAYINKYIEAYTNPNLTTWVDDYKQTVPKNSFLGEC